MSARLRWVGSFALVVASYAAVGSVLVAWKPNYEAPELMPQPVVLMELAPAPVPPPQIVPPPPPPPEPEPEQLPKVELPKPEAVLPPPPKKRPPPPKKHEEPPPPVIQPEPAPAAVKAPPAPVPMPQVASLPPSPDALAAYEGLLYAHLQSSIKYPRGAVMRHEQGVAQVHLVIDANGRLTSFKLIHPSGHEALDAEAIALLQRSPLPPRPAALGERDLVFDAPIVFRLR